MTATPAHRGVLMALDQATTTGYAIGRIEQPFVCTPIEMRAGGCRAELASGFIRTADTDTMRRWLTDTIRRHNVRGIIHESPILVQNRGGRGTSLDTARLLYALADTIASVAKAHGLWIAENGRSSAYKAVIGKGNAKKPDARDHLRALGFDVTSLDESDAIIHWHAAALLLRDKGW